MTTLQEEQEEEEEKHKCLVSSQVRASSFILRSSITSYNVQNKRAKKHSEFSEKAAASVFSSLIACIDSASSISSCSCIGTRTTRQFNSQTIQKSIA
jgi:hypothetical protein